VESLGPMNWEARKFLADLGRKISRVFGDDRETMFLFQRISVLLFRFNSVLLHNSFELDDRLEHWPLHSILTFSIFSYPRFSRV